MKYILYALAGIYIIWAIFFLSILNSTKVQTLNIEKTKKSIVIIIPEKELINYNNNPKWLFKNINNSGIWAWFFINSDWLIQTVNHIIENENIKYKVIYNWKEYDSEIISRNKDLDLAQLKINLDNIRTKKLTLAPWKKWEKIYSFWIDQKSLQIIYNTWSILDTEKKLDIKSSLIEISNPLSPGFSWWPILNQNWEVVWINYATQNWKNYWIKLN